MCREWCEDDSRSRRSRNRLPLTQEAIKMLINPFHLFQFFLCGFLFFIHTAEGQNELLGYVGGQLYIPCVNAIQAKYISLKVKNIELQNFDLKNNKLYCVESNPYHNKCATQMNGTLRMGNLVMFMVKEAWKELDGKSCQCFVRYNGYNKDVPGQMRTIRLQDRNSTETETPTNVPKSDTGKGNVSSPNVTAKKDNTKTFSSGVGVGAFFGGFFLCFLVLVPVSFLAIRLYIKYYKPSNGNIPSQD
ncbi:uncharacterized protein LOC116296126 isoform X2 [Actinia tenebrosa]|uniref:Uncharacterized protein LOC116296126 isoform X2 n=1 Tax=Actinia tenebrosa TaxID=6105 RepID=A0A6P8I5C0_ACTTE|nr:uncharacterized protein LOC116296126 isoform X2 [Actinia tenebrosa]